MTTPFRALPLRLAVPLLAGLCLAPPATAAEDKFPSRALQIVVPFDAGGGLDLHARALAPVMERMLRQPVVVVNKPGGAGAVGLQSVGRGKPDGYTLVTGLPSITSLPEVDRIFDRPQRFSRDMFAPVALLSTEPLVLVVQHESRWKTVPELIADAKRRPDAIQYSSAGPYGPSHVATEMFTHLAGIRLRHVPYTGAGPSLTALLGGHVDLYLSPPSIAVAHMKKGTLRALAVTSARRHPRLPEIPALKELGVDAEFYNWYGLFAPKATPPEVLATLREAVRAAVADPDFVAAMAKIETPITYLGGEEFEKFLERDAAFIVETIRRIGKVN